MNVDDDFHRRKEAPDHCTILGWNIWPRSISYCQIRFDKGHPPDVMRWGCIPLEQNQRARGKQIVNFVVEHQWVTQEPDIIVFPFTSLVTHEQQQQQTQFKLQPLIDRLTATLSASIETVLAINNNERTQVQFIKAQSRLYLNGLGFTPPVQATKDILDKWQNQETINDFNGVECHQGMAFAFTTCIAQAQLIGIKDS